MSIRLNCEGCPFYNILQEDATRLDDRTAAYYRAAPDATDEQIREAIDKFRQMADGAATSLPDCSGYNFSKGKKAGYLLNKLFLESGEPTIALMRDCKNPFVNTDEFNDLLRESHPYYLQREALKAKGEDEKSLYWPPSQFIKNWREAYGDFGPMQKLIIWAVPVMVAASGLNLILHPSSDESQNPNTNIEQTTGQK